MKQATVDAFQTNDTENRPDKIGAVYARSDAGEGSINDQFTTGVQYSLSDLGYELNEEKTRKLTTSYPDVPRGRGATMPDSNTGIGVHYDTSETHPTGVEKLLRSTHEMQDVIVQRLVALSDSIQDIIEIVEVINDDGATVHAVDDGIEIAPGEAGQHARALLRACARADSEAPARVTGRRHHGRPPAGHTVEQGQLRKADDYNDLRQALIAVNAGDISYRQAAKQTQYSRATIKKATSRTELYRLD